MSARLPVVFAADNNYAIPLLVSALSLYRSANEGTSYEVVVLVPSDFDVAYKHALYAMARDHGMPEPRFEDMGAAYADAQMRIAHTSLQTYYRLLIPELFDFDACLYLDVDIVVRHDLSDLFGQLGPDDLLAGVRAAGYNWPREHANRYAQELGIDALDQYVNAGVLLMNVALMRERDLCKTFGDLMSRDFRSQDQDILNKACYGHIRILPPRYNSMTTYDNDDASSYDAKRHACLPACYTREEWSQACTDPAIVHYANKLKPWNMLGIPRVFDWWQTLDDVESYIECKETLMRELAHREREEREELTKRLQSIQKHFSKNITARCEFIFAGEAKPEILACDVSDRWAYTMSPTWLKNNETGMLVQSDCGTLDVAIACKDDALLRIVLRSIDDRDESGQRTDHWLLYRSFLVDGVEMLASARPASYLKYITHTMSAQGGETVHIHVDWVAYSLGTEYQSAKKIIATRDARIKQLEAELDALREDSALLSRNHALLERELAEKRTALANIRETLAEAQGVIDEMQARQNQRLSRKVPKAIASPLHMLRKR